MDLASQIISPPPSLDSMPAPPVLPPMTSSKRPPANGTPPAKRLRPAVARRRASVGYEDDDDDDDEYDSSNDEEVDDDDDEDEHVATDDEDGDYGDESDEDDDDDEDDVDDAPVTRSAKKPAALVPATAVVAVPLSPQVAVHHAGTAHFKSVLQRFFKQRKRAGRGFCAIADEYGLSYTAGDERGRPSTPFAVFMLSVSELPDAQLCVKITGNGGAANMAVYAGADSSERLANYGYVYDDATWDLHSAFHLPQLLVLCMLLRCVLTSEGELDRQRLTALGPNGPWQDESGVDCGNTLMLLLLVVEGVEEERQRGKK